MEIIKLRSIGKYVFRIIVKEKVMSLETANATVKEHLGGIYYHIKIMTANSYTYIDLPVDTIHGTDFGKLVNAITDIERFHQEY